MTSTSTQQHSARNRILRQLALHIAVALACPAVLYTIAGDPLAIAIPSPQAVELWWNITRYNPAYALPLLIRLLLDTAWLAWAWHTAWTLAALTWIALRLRATALPRLLLRFAPALAVQALAVGTAAAATGHPAPAVHTATDHQHEQPAANTGTATASVTVQPDDTLWKLAEEHYGQGQNWPEIYQANHDRHEPDGSRLTDPSLIRPGWRLTIPADSALSLKQPESSKPHIPSPLAREAAHRPSPAKHPDIARPHSVGLDLPDGGYVGVTFATAIAAACALLNRRHRALRSSTTPSFPATAELLSGTATAARAAERIGYEPDEHHGAPPLLNRPHPEPPTIGALSGDDAEATAHGSRGSILSYTGPAAEDAARALILETLATALQHRGTQRDNTRLIIDQTAAHTLLGIRPADSLPYLLTVLDEPFTAKLLAQTPGPLIAISHSDPASIAAFQWAASERAEFTGLLLGPTPDTKTITALDLAEDGRARTATGPRAHDLANIRFHTLPYPAARSLLSLVYEAATPSRQTSPSTPTREETAAREEPDDPTDRAATALPGHEQSSVNQKLEPAPTATQPRAEVGSPVRPTPLLLRLLGPITVDGPAGSVSIDTDRSAAILTLLALHPAGRSAEAMGDEIWKGKLPDHRPLSPVYTALQRTRTLLNKALTQPSQENAAEPLITENGRYRLDPNTVTTDLALQRKLETRAERTTDPAARYRLLAQAAGLYSGELAEGLGPDSFEELMIARTEAQIRAQRLHLAAATTAADLGPSHHPAALEHVQAALDIEPADRTTSVRAHRLYQQLNRPDLARASRQLHESACTALGLDPLPAIQRGMPATTAAPYEGDPKAQRAGSNIMRLGEIHFNQAGGVAETARSADR